MTVKDVVIRSLRLLGREDIVERLSSGEGITDTEQSAVVATLVYCFNAVEDELARNYFPLVTTQYLAGAAGRFYFKNLSFQPVSVLAVSENGKKIDFEVEPNYFTADASYVSVEYEYTPSKRDLTGDCAYDGSIVGETLEAVGILSEFCLINGEIEAAKLWESRYRTEVDRARKKLPPSDRIPPRRWV